MSRAILIVDDDPMALRLLRHHLVSAGHVVLSAENGLAALELIRHNADPPSLVITDWDMPEMNGIDLVRHLRHDADEGMGYVYTIVLTGNDSEDRIVEAIEAGADDYLTKPFRRNELLARLRAGERIVELERNLARRTREVFRSNAEMELANRKLNRMATTDELTGCPNRRAAMTALDRQWKFASERGEPMACIMLDIDHFKAFNDEHGHDLGDLVLKQTATALMDQTRAREPAYRVGGEEFLVLCPRSDAAGAVSAAERLRAAIEATVIEHSNGPFHVTISLGVAERTPDMEKPDDLLKRADEALYEAKRGGRNRVALRSGSSSVPAEVIPERRSA